MTICCKEFKDRVSQKRNILPHRTLSDALKNFAVTVSPAEEEEERVILLQAKVGYQLSTAALDYRFSTNWLTTYLNRPVDFSTKAFSFSHFIAAKIRQKSPNFRAAPQRMFLEKRGRT